MEERVSNYVRADMYDAIGREVAQCGLTMEVPEIIQELSFIDFAKLRDDKEKTYGKINNPDELRTIKFHASDNTSKEIQFRLDKKVKRIDFKSVHRAEVKMKDLLEIIYLYPEVNVIVEKIIGEPAEYNISQARVGSEINFYFKEVNGSFSQFASMKEDETVIAIGNKGRILLKLFYELGKYLEVPVYVINKPKNKEEKAIYEVAVTRKFYRN